MTTIKGRKTQLSVAGVAALAIFAVAAVMLLAGSFTTGPAQAQGDADNADHYDKPIPCSEEVEPDANTVGLIREGYYAVFDAFWDYEVNHLSNNFCPPEVTVTTKEEVKDEETVTETVNTRSNANTHISKTVFSLPESYKVTVIDSQQSHGHPDDVRGPTIDLADYPFLKNGGAVSAVDNEDNPRAFAGNSLYWVKLDDPQTENVNEKSDLQIGFSTALLKDADWYRADGKPVQLRFSAVHVLKDGTPVEAHVHGAHMFAFNPPGAPQDKAQWSNVRTATESDIDMDPGEYRPMQFAFTKPGVYLVQAHVQGYVREKDDPKPANAPEDWKPISPDQTITSPVQWYTFHVGPEADLDISLTAGAVSGSEVPVTVTASNSGPNDAENVEVEINLPAGLSAPATLPEGASSSGCGVIAWEIGPLASGASPTLSFNANVDAGAVGKLTATAEIRSTTFDPDAADNAASVEATLSGTNVRAPYFPGVSRTIVEHAVVGAHAGDPVAAESPDGRPVSYSLSGPCSNKFQVHSNGQIVLAPGHNLDYETQWEYPLILHVSDGVNASGEADTSADDSMPVLIQVQDTDTQLHPTVTFTLTPNNSEVPVTGSPVADGRTYFLRTTLNNAPAGATLVYDWDEVGWHNPLWSNRFHTSYFPTAEADPGPKVYTVHITWPGGGISVTHTVTFVAASP